MIPFLNLRAAYRELKTEIDEKVASILDGGQYILGPEVEAFEEEWAAYCEAGYAVGLGNGLDALSLAMRALDIGVGHEVIVPSNTYIATWLAVSSVGAKPVPVEPNPITHNIDTTKIEAAITPQTRAILPVHLYGQPADLDVILDVAHCNGLRVIEDAAQAHGARYKGKRIGAHGDIVCWSFYPGKNLGAMGDAGGITTNDKAIAQKVALLRNYGSRQKYVNETAGSNSRLDPIQAGVLRVKMRHLDKWTDRRRHVAATYTDCLQTTNLKLPHVPVWSEPAWHLYVVRTLERDVLQSRLMKAGINTIIHYPIPPHMQRAYTGLKIAASALPISQKLASTVLSLPMGPHLSSDEIVCIAQTLQHLVSDLDLNPSKSGQ
jgi:dTDP-4-amino-4,6-dideoxygalactose transaminase